MRAHNLRVRPTVMKSAAVVVVRVVLRIQSIHELIVAAFRVRALFNAQGRHFAGVSQERGRRRQSVPARCVPLRLHIGRVEELGMM